MEQRSFDSPEEEIQYLKNRVVALEKPMKGSACLRLPFCFSLSAQHAPDQS